MKQKRGGTQNFYGTATIREVHRPARVPESEQGLQGLPQACSVSLPIEFSQQVRHPGISRFNSSRERWHAV